MKTAPLLAAFAFFAASPAWAGVVAYVDYSDFQSRLDEATATAGVAAFTAAERSRIEANVLAGLRRTYAAHAVDFRTASAGHTERIWFGASKDRRTRSASVDGIDWRNRSDGDLARVYSGNFGGFIERSDPRDRQIAELSRSLTGTAAHELGHNLGLLHQDSYGNAGFTYDGFGDRFTGGAQNRNVMATGGTGLNEGERETERGFSRHSLLKLEFAEGVTHQETAASTAETDLPHATRATAQALTLAARALSGLNVANVVGAITAAIEEDWYELDLAGPGFLTAATITNGVAGAVDTILSVFDAAGRLLGRVDDTRYDGDSFGSGTLVSRDSVLFNLEIAEAGRYFARVESFASGRGNYELLLGFDGPAGVPEPGSWALALLAGAGWVAKRRRGSR